MSGATLLVKTRPILHSHLHAQTSKNLHLRFYLGRADHTLRVPKSVKTLRRLIETRLPRVRIEDLLAAVDQWTGFSREFVPLGGESARAENLYPTLLAALVGHGTNLARIDHRFGNEGDFGRPERFSESFAIDPVQVE